MAKYSSMINGSDDQISIHYKIGKRMTNKNDDRLDLKYHILFRLNYDTLFILVTLEFPVEQLNTHSFNKNFWSINFKHIFTLNLTIGNVLLNLVNSNKVILEKLYNDLSKYLERYKLFFTWGNKCRLLIDNPLPVHLTHLRM